MTQKIEITTQGIEFDSPYTNTAAGMEFRRLVENGDLAGNKFAADLYAGAKKYGKYTDRQIPWLHVLIANHENRPTRPAVAPVTGLKSIHSHLANCRKSREDGGKGLLHPQVGLRVDGQTVVLKLAGAKSKHNGKVSVASDHRFGQGTFYGYIDEDGNFDTRRPVQAVNDILNRVAVDPARVISEIGKESGRCCYCFAELTTVQSKIAGCGKTCADNYGVNYPRANDVRHFIDRDASVLEGASDREKWESATV